MSPHLGFRSSIFLFPYSASHCPPRQSSVLISPCAYLAHKAPRNFEAFSGEFHRAVGICSRDPVGCQHGLPDNRTIVKTIPNKICFFYRDPYRRSIGDIVYAGSSLTCIPDQRSTLPAAAWPPRAKDPLHALSQRACCSETANMPSTMTLCLPEMQLMLVSNSSDGGLE